MFALYLNMMRGNSDAAACVAVAETEQALHDFMKRESVEPYTGQGLSGFHSGMTTFHKTFKKGGPLEWYNTLGLSGPYGGIVPVPTEEEHRQHLMECVEVAMQNYKLKFVDVIRV